MNSKFSKFVKYTLLSVYFVIIAGALVRMTGSGMGCPDWPKCFGYYIPPTSESELIYTPNREYKKGQVIILNEKLWVANERFIATESIDLEKWKPYTKHDYAKFNVSHTWTEYLNRLAGALAGIMCFILAVYATKFWKKDKWITILSWLVVFSMGFQAWLGALVVESVLNPVKITGHMLMAILIVAMILIILNRSKKDDRIFIPNQSFKIITWIALITSIIQIILGTQVRQFVDLKIKELGYDNMHQILTNPDVYFYVHRSFSFLVVGLALYGFYLNKNKRLGFHYMNWVLCCIGLEIASGLSMYYFDFPFGMQSIHLVMATVLFGIQFYILLKLYNSQKKIS